MNIELKNIKFYEKLSEETNCFTADLFVDNKNVGHVKNGGHGGSTDYAANKKEDWEHIKKAEQFCLTLPKKSYGTFTVDMNLENKIDELFEEWLKEKEKAKFDKKLQKDMLKALCIKTNNGYETLTWKAGSRQLTIEELISVEQGKQLIKRKIADMKLANKEILNTNIPQEFFN